MLRDLINAKDLDGINKLISETIYFGNDKDRVKGIDWNTRVVLITVAGYNHPIYVVDDTSFLIKEGMLLWTDGTVGQTEEAYNRVVVEDLYNDMKSLPKEELEETIVRVTNSDPNFSSYTTLQLLHKLVCKLYNVEAEPEGQVTIRKLSRYSLRIQQLKNAQQKYTETTFMSHNEMLIFLNDKKVHVCFYETLEGYPFYEIFFFDYKTITVLGGQQQ